MESNLFKFLVCISSDIGDIRVSHEDFNDFVVIVESEKPLSQRQVEFARLQVMAPFKLVFKLKDRGEYEYDEEDKS